MKHIPRKRFGQHFLTDATALNHIVQSIHPLPGQALLEIGPGLGALTDPVLRLCQRLEVVELDRDVIPKLQQRCATLGELIVHQQDALSFDFSTIANEGRPLRVIGNLPYNISTPLIFHLLSFAQGIQDMHFLLQKEVVQRLCAQSSEQHYGRLGIMVQYRCQTEYLFDVGPQSFDPPPKVDSAVVRLTPYAELPHQAKDETLLAKLVQQAFSQRRKTLRNTLKGMADSERIESVGIDPQQRPETVSIEQFVALSNALSDAAA